MTVIHEREFYTVAEAARLLDVSSSTVRRWIRSRRLPAYRVGPRRMRVKREDLAGVVGPAGGVPKGDPVEREVQDIWAAYDPERVKKVLAETGGSWADLDTDRLIADLYRAREEGSRPVPRP